MERLEIVRTARLFRLYREVMTCCIEVKMPCSPCNSFFGILSPKVTKFKEISFLT